jgi:ATP-dependent Clp protease protease subunit
MLHVRDKLNGILAQHTGRDLKQLQKDTDRNFFMSAEQSKEYGIVDEVIAKRGVS